MLYTAFRRIVAFSSHPYFSNKLKLALKPSTDGEVLVSRERATDFKKWMGK